MGLRAVPDRFAVAFSLAGEQRALVLPIARAVEAVLGPSTVFYDDWYEHWIAGQDADLLLGRLYGELAELVVVCVSQAYGEKAWTRTEHRVVRDRLMRPGMDRQAVLPIRVGEGGVDGVHFIDIVPDVRTRSAAAAAELIVSRLRHLRGVGHAVDVLVPPSCWPAGPPQLVWPMADHWDARAAFAALLSSTSERRVLLVRGASETGKSHMSRQMLRNAMTLAGVRSARFDLKGTTNMDLEVEAFCEALDVESPSGASLAERLSRVVTELRKQARPVVLIFDSYEAAGEVGDWVEERLLPRVHSATWMRVVVVGQSVPDRRGTIWEPAADPPLELQSPGAEHWFEYGRVNRGDDLKLELVAQVHQLANGKASVLASLFGPLG